MKLISLSVREFALPTPRVGSIDALSGYGRSTQEGIEIHQRVQQRRAKVDSAYRAEVAVSHDFEREGYLFRVGGRMDGIFDRKIPHIEEIKSTFGVAELLKRLSNPEIDHPYSLQLRTYGYLHWIQKEVEPKLSFHLVSTRNSGSEDLEIPLRLKEYEEWRERRLAELVEEARRCEQRSERRRKLAAGLEFPFDSPRPGQTELIAEIETGMRAKERMLIQAPTGLGKTVGVLYPTLKEALSRGQRVIYVTPKNSQHAVAEDAIERFQERGSRVKSLTITAKGKICFKNEPLCNPGYCEYARDYYTKVHQHGLVEKLSKKKKLKAKHFRDLGEEFEVCPFELQLDASAEADAVICDYNYVFAPRAALGSLGDTFLGQEGKANLVIDEAHNLPARAMDCYSPALSTVALERMREEIRELPMRFRLDAEELLDDCIRIILDCRPEGPPKAAQIDPPTEPFLEQDSVLRAFLSRYLESDYEIQPRDVVLRLCFYWSAFAEALEFVSGGKRDEFFTTFQPLRRGSGADGGTVKITCCDASEMLHACYDSYDQVVGFSATLKPFDYYAKLSGLKAGDAGSPRVAGFRSPFPKANRKLLIIPQVSTKYSERERNYGRIAEAIEKIAGLHRGNYFAFFPSFDFMERVLGIFRAPPGFSVLKQEREMRASAIDEVMTQLQERSRPTIVFAVQGGVFSEGVDYPGETIIGAFVVGPPLPSFDLEREEMRKYYDRSYGSGFDYAYTFPAMSKAVQAAGRVIRSETDRGLIVLLDGRFIHPAYTQSMPEDWFDESARELVSQRILSEVSEFWALEAHPVQST